MTDFWQGFLAGALVGVVIFIGWFLSTYDVNWGGDE